MLTSALRGMTIGALLASIALFVPVQPGVNVSLARCPALQQDVPCTVGDNVYIDTTRGTLRDFDVRMTLAHELGHVWDAHNLTDRDRSRYEAFLGKSGPWLGYSGTIGAGMDPAPGELFADAFALCSTSHRRRHAENWNDGSYWGTYWEPISARTLAATCWLVQTVAHREGVATSR